MPKPYTGTPYDGSSNGYDQWLADMKGILAPMSLYPCLKNPDFYGYVKGSILLGAPPEEIELGLDTQSRLCAWLQTTLTGKAKIMSMTLDSNIAVKNAQIEKLPEAEQEQIRAIPSAFDLHQTIKADSKPAESVEINQALMREAEEDDLQAGCTHDEAMTWFEGILQRRNELIGRGLEGYLDEQFFLSGLFNRVKHISGDQMANLRRATKACCADGKFSIQGFRNGLTEIYPLSLCASSGTQGRGALNWTSGTRHCSHCEASGGNAESHNTEDCYRRPGIVCTTCNKEGHSHVICPHRKGDRSGKGDKGDKGGKGDRAQQRKDKRAGDKALIAFAKQAIAAQQPADADPAAAAHGAQYGMRTAPSAPATERQGETVEINGKSYYPDQHGGYQPVSNAFYMQPQVQPRGPRRGAIHIIAAHINAAAPVQPSFEIVNTEHEEVFEPLVIDPDYDPEIEHAQRVLDEQPSPIVPGSSIMIHAPPTDWVAIRVLLDGGCDTTAISLNGNLRGHEHVLLGAKPSDMATKTGGGLIFVSQVGQALFKVGPSFTLIGTDCELYPDADWDYDMIVSEAQWEEDYGLKACKETGTLNCPDGTSTPIIRSGRQGRLKMFDCYIYVGGDPKMVSSVHLKSSAKSAQDWHEVLGCPGKTTLAKTLPIVNGLPPLDPNELETCTWCEQAKGKRQPIERDPSVPPREYGPREAVGMDLSARQVLSIQGAQYLQLVIDFGSRLIVGQLLALKNDAVEAFREYCVKYSPPDIVQSDGDGNYEGLFTDFCAALHIEQRRSAPNTQAQNYIAEIGMRLVFTTARALLLRSGLPLKFWADAVMNAIDCINVRFTKGVQSGKTPFEEHFGYPPDLSMWQKFGAPANVFVHHPEHKFAPRTVQGIFVRMAMGYKAWRIFIPEWDAYAITRHATFDMLPAQMPQADPEIEGWTLEGVREDKDDEIIDGKGTLPASGKPPPKTAQVVNPLPPARESADLNTRPPNTGTSGNHRDWTDFYKQRYLEYQRAESSTAIAWPSLMGKKQKRALKQREAAHVYREYYKKGLPVPPVSAAGCFLRGGTDTPTHGEGGDTFTDPEIKKKKEELEPHLNLEPDSDESDDEPMPVKAKPDADISDDLKPEKERAPRVADPSPPPSPEPNEEAPPSWSPAKTRSQSKATINAMSKAAKVVADTDGPIHQGHFTEESWQVMYALHGKDPNTLLEAMNGPDAELWRKAVEEELQSLIDLNVYKTIKLKQVPKGKKILHAKVVLKYKEFEQRYKARLVVLGFMQSDEDAGETFAPVAKFTTFRLLMAIACALDLDISSSDVKTAFLNAVLTEPIYIYPPKRLGFPPDEVWKLLKNLYGLKGAPRGWNLNLHSFLLEIGFTQSIIDPCLYHIKDLWVLVWVDDTLKVGSPEAIAWFEDQCNQRYTMTHVKETEMFVGIEITRDRENRVLELKQTAYFEKILQNCGMLEDGQRNIGQDTPMAENTKVTRDDCCMGDPERIAEVKKITQALGWEYASPAASLLYAAICTRPDLAFTCKEICKVMADPGPKHFTVLKRALKYLRATMHRGLKFQATSQEIMDSLDVQYLGRLPADITLEAWCDASFGDDPDTKRSTQAFLAKLCGAAVSWFSQGQKSTSLSTAEAELIALADGIKEILYMREAMTFFGVAQLGPTIVYEDNAAVVATAHNPGKNHGKLKHVAIRTSRVQEEVRLETIDVVHKGTHLMQADILTKALGKVQFILLALAILGYHKLTDGK
jgi:hypothetical protein